MPACTTKEDAGAEIRSGLVVRGCVEEGKFFVLTVLGEAIVYRWLGKLGRLI